MPTYSVLQVTPALDAGGVERTTIEVAEAVARDGGAALVASSGGRLEDELTAVGGELIRIPADTKNPIEIWANAGRIARAAAERGVDLIHARSRAPAWSAYWAARKLGKPFVTTYHGIYNAKSGLKRRYNEVMARGDVVIANSEYTRQHILRTHKLDPDRVVTIPRGVDLARFDPAAVARARVEALRRAWSAPADRFTVLVPARLTRWKGQLEMIEAAARIRMVRKVRIKLVLAGDAQGREGYLQELNAAVAAGDLDGDVVITGHLADMPAAYLAADAVALPSIEPEAFGRSAVEAQAMGRVVIASAAGGYLETIEDGETGFLIKPGAIETWAAALDHVMTMSPAERAAIGAKASAGARARYSKEALQAATLGVYHRLLKRPES